MDRLRDFKLGLPRALRGVASPPKWSMAMRHLRRFNILPKVNGKTVWDLDLDAPLNLGSAGVWTITPLSSFSCNSKMWGGGGGCYPYGGTNGNGGGGGKVSGEVFLLAGVTYELQVAAAGVGRPYSGGGGGMSFLRVYKGEHLLLAGGGGGAGSGAEQTSNGEPSPGLGADNYTPASWDGRSATKYQGGEGGKHYYVTDLGETQISPGGADGTRLAGGKSANNVAGDGGDGWFGGGGGSQYYDGNWDPPDSRAGCGGGGCCYLHRTVRNAKVWAGAGRYPGDKNDADRAGAGDGAIGTGDNVPSAAGRLILS